MRKEIDIKNSKYAKGEEVNGSLLNPGKVIRIRSLYETGEYKQTELAKMLNVSNGAIHDVIHRRTWKHID